MVDAPRPRQGLPVGAFLVCLCWACLAPTPSPGGPQDPPGLTEPGLDSLEAGIRGQIQAQLAAVRSLASKTDTQAPELAEAYGTLGRLLQIYEIYPAARAALMNARLLAPEDLRWPYLLAHLHILQGEKEEAALRFQESLALRPHHLPSLIRLGNLYLSLDRPSEAAELFHRALEAHGPSAAAYFGAGKARTALNDPARAVGYFRQALEIEPQASVIHYPLAQAYRRLGDLDRARQHLEQRGLVEVSLPDPVTEELDQLTTVAALQLVRALARKEEGFSEADFLGYVLSLLARVPGAIDEMEGWLMAWPSAERQRDAAERGRLHYAVGGLLVHRGFDDRALEHFRNAVELDPDLQDGRVKLANVLARAGDYSGAVAELTRVLEDNPTHPTARLKRVAALMASNRPARALPDLERLVGTEPNNPEVRFRLATCLEQLGRRQDAIRHYLAAADLAVSSAQKAGAHYRAARLLVAGSSFQRARSQYEAAVAAAPNLSEARLELANLLGHLGELEAAAEHFRQLTVQRPELEEARRGEAFALVLLSRYGEARRRLEEGLERIPTSLPLKTLLARLLAAAPEASVRDGDRALELAQAVYRTRRSLESAETLAMAYAEVGDLEQAVRLLRGAESEAADAGRGAPLQALRSKLNRYASGQVWRPATPQELLPPK